MEQNNPKTMNAWAFYDWANSVYNLVITTSIFPLFFKAVAVHNTKIINGKEVGFLNFFGFEIINTSLYAYVFAASFLVVVIIMPILSGIADYTGSRKKFLQFFCYLGALSCMSLFFFDPEHIELSMLSPFFASIGFWGSLVFYNSYLPIIASPDKQDALSAKGFSMGYVGSVLLLVSILIASQKYGMPIKYSFLAVGVWWAGFAQYTYLHLPEKINKNKKRAAKEVISEGYKELQKVWRQIKTQNQLTRFLAAFFTYNTGVQTVLLLAVIFAEQEIDWPIGADGEKERSGLIISMILIQLVAVVGAYVMSKLSKKRGNIIILQMATLLWIVVCLTAFFIHTPTQFYILAALVGFVMGGIQSLSRSTYSKMLPETEDITSYFSFYDVLEKIGLIIGPVLFGTVNWITGGMRPSILVVGTFFIIGFILLFRVPRNLAKSI